jgi:hypothetical protein
MVFEAEGQYLKISADKTDGTKEVRWMHKVDAMPMLNWIMQNSTTQEPGVDLIITPAGL